MKISIVIINKNDRGISDTLTTLSAIKTSFSYEIVVVDGSGGKLDDIKKTFPTVKWIQYNNLKKNKITIPEQRNVGVLAASGDIIVFTDASCVPHKGWLEHLVEPIINENESIVAGATLSRGKPTLHDQSQEVNKNNQYIDECPTINLAFTRKLYDRVGGFDERFDYGSDIDFSWRVIDAGYRVRYQPKAIVSHDWGSIKHELKRSYYYGRARARLYLKHKRVRYLVRHETVRIIYLIFILGLPITFWWYWYPALILIPLTKNYNKKPLHTVIDHLVYAVAVLYEVLVHSWNTIL